VTDTRDDSLHPWTCSTEHFPDSSTLTPTQPEVRAVELSPRALLVRGVVNELLRLCEEQREKLDGQQVEIDHLRDERLLAFQESDYLASQIQDALDLQAPELGMQLLAETLDELGYRND